MSYQPQQPMGAMPPAGVPMGQSYGAPPAAPTPKKGKGVLYAGLGLVIVGLGAGAALFAMSGSAEESTVKKFARAPVGCTTTLEFDKSSTFTLYVETKGSVGDVGGDCSANGSSYDRGDDNLPKVSLTLLDSDDKEVDLASATTPKYSAGAFKGEALQTVQIDTPGTYRLTVTSEDTDFAIAIGGAPDADSSTMKNAGIGAAIAGLVLGGLLILLGRRKKGGQVAPAGAPGWQPQQPSVPGYQPQPSYAPQQPGYQQPTYQQPAPTYQQPPTAPPPAPPAGPDWGAPHQ
jgi:hypothetical protein